jgi:hypothetical protein
MAEIEELLQIICDAYNFCGGSEIKDAYNRTSFIKDIIDGNGYTHHSLMSHVENKFKDMLTTDITLENLLIIHIMTVSMMESPKQHQFYYVVNEYRRKADALLNVLSPCYKYFNLLATALKSVPNKPVPKKLYRYISVDSNDFIVNNVYDMSFSSTSDDKQICSCMGDHKKIKLLLIFNNITKCKSISEYSEYPKESEWMILSEAHFVIKNMEVIDDIVNINLEEC